MKSFYTDLHVHIGRAKGKPVKIAASPTLTVDNVIDECRRRKGIQIVGIVDAVCTPVFAELKESVAQGRLQELPGGGLATPDRKLTVLLGAELEAQTAGKAAHYLAYFPTVERLAAFRACIAPHVTNLGLSSQLVRLSAPQILAHTIACDGMFLLAHAFTPHKGFYGNCADRLSDVFDEKEIKEIAAIELGLSADSTMGDTIAELHQFTFVSNSDAHSLAKIGREYSELRLEAPTFTEVQDALGRRRGRKVAHLYGLDPRLGKYHTTFCRRCDETVPLHKDRRCRQCGEPVVVGVADRLAEIADTHQPAPDRPPYRHQVPLEFVPGLGSRRLGRLIDRFGSEMAVLHEAEPQELVEAVGERTAAHILAARDGRLDVVHGAGGRYGRVR